MSKAFIKAKEVKNDEFYTSLSDIENELKHYRKHLEGKTILCNCDSRDSAFFKYFEIHSSILNVKKVIFTSYNGGEQTTKITMVNGIVVNEVPLWQNGDFRSEEVIEVAKAADIIITNPPFSLFREYISQLFELNKDFIVVGPSGCVGYKEIFPLMKDKQMWMGASNPKEFTKPDGTVQKFGNICWFTNLTHNRKNRGVLLYKKYNKEDYSFFDGTELLNINKLKDIPVDYYDVMAVPKSFFGKYNPNQFEILGMHNGGNKKYQIEGKHKQDRLHIKRIR